MPFPILNQSIVPCTVLTVDSCPAYRFLRRQVRWSGISISLRIFQFGTIHTVKGFSVVNEADVFFGILLIFSMIQQLLTIWSLVSAFSKFSLNIWKFLVHILLKPSLQNFEHHFASVWNECNCGCHINRLNKNHMMRSIDGQKSFDKIQQVNSW